jgi:GxxExxY protein
MEIKEPKMMTENELAAEVIGCAIAVHRALGPGLLESAYEQCLAYELRKSGFRVDIQKPMPLVYEEVEMDCGYRIDILVEDKLILELKAVERLLDVHMAQTLTYLKLSECKLGLLMNFNVPVLKKGIQRVVNGL